MAVTWREIRNPVDIQRRRHEYRIGSVAPTLTSMAKMPHPREDHGQIMLIGSLDHLLIPDGPSRLNHSRHAGLRSGIHAVSKREEGVRGHDTPFDRQLGFHAG